MDFEQKYKEALERAKRLHGEPTGGTERIVCEQIFPELKESEDERIREELIEHIKANKSADYVLFKRFSIYTSDKKKCDQFIAWLEKHKEENMGNDGKISLNPYMGKEEFKKLVESNIINTSITWHDTIDQLWELYRKRLDPDTVVEWLYEQINSGSMQVDNISKTETTFKEDFGL